ncbi:Uncharacterised protein [Allocoprococcus comes]|nr:Uncharacterised protein [Coprococcus comes]
MNDIFKDMQAKVGCEYISDLPSYKRKVWQEMKRLNPADYEERQLEKLWNDKYYLDENVLLVNMTRLKKKMKEIGIVHLLENIRGKGWKL